MAASQPTAPASGNGTGNGNGNGNASNSASAAGSGNGSPHDTGDTGAVASAAPTPSNPSSKPGTPNPKASAPPTVPERDKDSLNKVLVDRYMTRDWLHSAALKDAQDRMMRETRETRERAREYKSLGEPGQRHPAVIFGEGYNGYGNGRTEIGGPTKILYPSQKRHGRRSNTLLKYSRKDMKKQAEEHEELVPIRIDVDWEKIKLRDTFTYNLHDRLVQVEQFAAQLVEDIGLKQPQSQPVFEQVMQQMHEQLQEYYPHVYSEEEALDPHQPYTAYKNDEMRILVKLNITIGAHTLVDQFEWDINNPMNSPEEFAACMTRDLALSGEFTTAIAHCIREQAQLFTRSLYTISHPFDGRPIDDADLNAALLPSPIPTAFRPQQQAKDYAPYLYENTEAELEKSETMFSREQRRQKRSVNRRGGPVLPDLKERQRTIRTSIVSSVLPGAVKDIEDSRLFKRATGAGGISGRGKRGAREGDLSDSDESDDSMPDSPAMSQLQGTARTRGMRGAASAAAQRMANLGRSETPEAIIHHHETRTSRRFGREATREETEEPQTFIVTLKVSPARLRKLMRDLKERKGTPAAPGSGTPGPSHQPRPAVMGPPITPSASNQALPPKANTPSTVQAQVGATPKPPGSTTTALQPQIGRIPAPPPPAPGQPPHPVPPPPDWLTQALRDLQKQHPNDMFEGVMRYCAINTKTDTHVQLPQGGKEIPPDVQFMYLARIRCLDCTGKLYTPGPETTVGNFEVHLKNRQHREKVSARVAKNAATGATTSAPGDASSVAAAAPGGLS